MLDGVAGLVGSHPQCGDARAIVVLAGEGEALGGGVVVVGEEAVDTLDADAGDAGGAEHFSSGLGPGGAGARAYLAPAVEGGLDLPLGPKPEEEGDDDVGEEVHFCMAPKIHLTGGWQAGPNYNQGVKLEPLGWRLDIRGGGAKVGGRWPTSASPTAPSAAAC